VRPLAVAVGAALLVLAPAAVGAGDRTDLPLRNWGGFAVSRDPAYDDLERLVAAGLGGRTLLSTRPLSRTEAARIVARAVETIRTDRTGAWEGRRDLEPVLDRLMAEFREELAELGVPGVGPAPARGAVRVLPVDRAQARLAWASRDLTLPNHQGLRLESGLDGGLTFESRLRVGDWLAVYVQPEVLANDEFGAARLAQGYLKLQAWNVELTMGRESLWWGPALGGSLVLSNNAPPLDQVRLGAAEPFELPWVGRWLGPTKLVVFLAQLEARRDHPRARMAGMRATVAPWAFLELGISRTVMFGGEPSPKPDVVDVLRLLFDPPAGDDLARDPQLRSNNVFALDADVRLPNVHRWGLPARDLRLYGEFGWDDTCCETAFVPLKDALSFLVGVHLFGLFDRPGLELRAEYAESSALSFTHSTFTDGYWTRGHVISHVMGTDGRSALARVTHWLAPGLMVGVEGGVAEIGNTRAGFQGPRERRLGGGLDVSVRLGERFALFAAWHVRRVENRGFRAGEDGVDHVLRLELTRSFR
jgi:hypothetical protein